MENKEQENTSPDETGEKNNEPPLFRKEALEYQKTSFFGKATIIAPISFSVWTFGITIIALAIALFAVFGKYAKHYPATGMLVPSKGLIHVYPKNPGIVAKKYVQSGDKVTEGQLMYLVSTEQHSLAGQGAIAQQIELLEKQIELQKNRLEIAKKNIEQLKPLLEQKFITETEYQNKADEVLGLETKINELERELNNAKSSGDYAIRAPSDGTISALIAMAGDRVLAERPVASIIPAEAKLQAMLFVTTDIIGFIQPGQRVLLKYSAYPYRSFGLYDGTVDVIEKSILTARDVDLPVQVGQNPMTSLPFYRVVVNLDSQYVKAYGKDYPLTPGISLEADVIGNKRTILQWVLDPIYSLRGSLKSS